VVRSAEAFCIRQAWLRSNKCPRMVPEIFALWASMDARAASDHDADRLLGQSPFASAAFWSPGRGRWGDWRNHGGLVPMFPNSDSVPALAAVEGRSMPEKPTLRARYLRALAGVGFLDGSRPGVRMRDPSAVPGASVPTKPAARKRAKRKDKST